MISNIQLFRKNLNTQEVNNNETNIKNNYYYSNNIKSGILLNDCFNKSSNIEFKANKSEVNLDDFPGKKLGLVAVIGTPDDMESITNLVNKIAAEESGDPEPYVSTKERKGFVDTIKQAMEVPGACTILIKDKKGELVGCAQLTGYSPPFLYSSNPLPPLNPKMAILRNVCLEKDYRDKGIMTWAVHKLVTHAKKQGIFEEIRLSADNPVAIKIYTKEGFKPYIRKDFGEVDKPDGFRLDLRKQSS